MLIKNALTLRKCFETLKVAVIKRENTNVSGNRLISLILITSFACSTATFQGQKLKRIGVEKYVARVKEYGRLTRRHSSFYIGLYGQTWVNFMADSWSQVEELMSLNSNKLEHYLRGLRAMNLIKNAS